MERIIIVSYFEEFEATIRQFSTKKCILHGNRINDWLSGRNPFAVTVEMDLCGFCNHSCSFCMFADKHTKDMITYDEAVSIINQIHVMGAKSIVFTGGGEPTLNPNIEEIANYAHSLGLQIALVTNGSMLDRVIDIGEKFEWVRVSMDASNADMYSEIRSVPASEFGKVISNLAWFKRWMPYTTLGIAYMVFDKTKDSLDEAISIANQIGVDYIQFRPLLEDGFRLNPDEASRLSALQNGHTKVLFSFDRFFNQSRRLYNRCLGNFFVSIVAANKDVYTCCHFRGHKKFVLGNLKNESYASIWSRRKPVVVDKHCIKQCRLHYVNNLLHTLSSENMIHENFL